MSFWPLLMPVTTKNPHSTLWLRASWNRVPGTVANGDGYRGSSGPSTVTCRWSPTTQRQETSLMLSVAFGCLSWPPLSQFNTIHTLLLRERKRKSSVSLMGSWREEFLSIPPDMLGESWFWCVFLLSVKLAFCSAYWATDERLGRSHRDPYWGREELGLLSLTRFACQQQMPEIFNTC